MLCVESRFSRGQKSQKSQGFFTKITKFGPSSSCGAPGLTQSAPRRARRARTGEDPGRAVMSYLNIDSPANHVRGKGLPGLGADDRHPRHDIRRSVAIQGAASGPCPAILRFGGHGPVRRSQTGVRGTPERFGHQPRSIQFVWARPSSWF